MPSLLTDFIQLFLDGAVSWRAKLLFVALVAIYIVLPIDLIPDFLLPLGVVDDAGLVLAAMSVFVRQARRHQDDDSLPIDQEGDTSSETLILPAPASKAPAASALSSDAQQAQVVYREKPRGSNTGCAALVLVLILSPFVGLAILILSGSMALSAITAPIIDLLDSPARASIAASRTIVNQLQPMGQLVTYSAEFAKADIHVGVQAGLGGLCSHGANYVAQGTIEVGIDFGAIDETSISYNADNDAYTLISPPVTLSSCRIEFIDQYDQSFTLCGADWDTLRQFAQNEALSQFITDTTERGVLQRAQEQATILLGAFIRSVTDKPAHVVFLEEPAEPALPPSCSPESPSDWQKDQESGIWVKTD